MEKKLIIEFLSYPLIWFFHILSILPFRVLYVISKIFYFFLYYFPGYRKKVVYRNLSSAFPYKSHKEIISLSRRFYLHLANVAVEVIKLINFSPNQLKERCHYTNKSLELINSYLENNQSIIIVLGHYGNWEWAGSSFNAEFGKQPITVYRPIKNSGIDRLIKKIRNRFGIRVYPKSELPLQMFNLRHQVNPIALIADQTPSASNAYWMDFLNQNTPVFKGTARLSKKFNYPLIFCSARFKKRGFYEIHATLVASSPKNYDEETLTRLHTQMLEEEIIQAPEYWLWTHKRWKHKRKDEE